MREIGESPFRLDSPRPTVPFKDYAYNELRYQALALTRPEEAAALLRQAQADVDEKYRIYEEFANLGGGPAPAHVTTAVAKAMEAIPQCGLSEEECDGSDNALSGADAEQSDCGRRRTRHRASWIIFGELEDLGAGAVVLPSIVRGADRTRGTVDRSSGNNRRGQLCRSPDLFSRAASYGIGPAAYLETIRRASQSCRYPGHRQPERNHRPGMDSIRPRD